MGRGLDLTWKVATDCPRQHPLSATLLAFLPALELSKACGVKDVSLTSPHQPAGLWSLDRSSSIAWNLNLPGLPWPRLGPPLFSYGSQVAGLFLMAFFFFAPKEVGSSSNRSWSRKAFLGEFALQLKDLGQYPSGCSQGCFLSWRFDSNYLNVY